MTNDRGSSRSAGAEETAEQGAAPHDAARILPLTSIEIYHLADDSPRYPNVIACDLIVCGELDQETVRFAVRETAARHPLSCARLVQRPGRRPAWDIQPSCALSPELWTEGELPLRMDLRCEPPGKLVVLREPGRTRLSFRIHHAAIDGAGGLQVVTDWLLAYHFHFGKGKDKDLRRALDPDLLVKRNSLRLFKREFLSRLWIQPIAVLGAIKFLFRKVTPIVPGVLEGPDRNAATDMKGISIELDDAVMESLRQRAAQQGATINELVLHAVFLAIHRVRKSRGWHRAGEWLRLVIPMNIRDFPDRRLPASNRATIVQLDRTDRDFADPAGLIWGINYELGNIRKWNLEKTFLLVLKWMSIVPGWIQRSARKPVCRATSVVTNLGTPFERVRLPTNAEGKMCAGNLVIEDVELTVPLRPGTPLGFAVVRYGNCQRINLRFDPQVVPEPVATQLAREIRSILEAGEQEAGGSKQ